MTSLPTVSPRCRRVRARVFWWSLELLMPERSKVPDPEGHGGLSRVREVEVRFRTRLFVHVTVPANQRQHNSGRGPHLFKKFKLESAKWEGHYTGPTVFQCRGNCSIEISWTWNKGQLKRAGFLVSGSLTLSSALWTSLREASFSDFRSGPKKTMTQ